MAVCIVTGQNELTFSHTRPWTDPESMLVVAGLSFAMVHGHSGDIELDALIEDLCPEITRRSLEQEGIP